MMKLTWLTANQRWYVTWDGHDIVECYNCPRSWEHRKDAVRDLAKLNLAVDKKGVITVIGEVFGVSSIGIGNGESLSAEVSHDFCTCGVCP
jgi:Zn-finger protein